MRESKFELQQWTKWKYTLLLLEEVQERLPKVKEELGYDVLKSTNRAMYEKVAKVVNEIDKYAYVIQQYRSIIYRLENAVSTLLTVEEKAVALIYATNITTEDKLQAATLQGYSKNSFFEYLLSIYDKLDAVLEPAKIPMSIKSRKTIT